MFVADKLKLVDFGIAMQANVNSNTTNVVSQQALGTVNYMSPEALEQTSAGADHTTVNTRCCDLWRARS